jgi:hypothetical protein
LIGDSSKPSSKKITPKAKASPENLFRMGFYCLKRAFLICYSLGDYEVEDRINDSISFSKFYGLTPEKCTPEKSALSGFHSIMTEKNTSKKIKLGWVLKWF